MKLCQSENKIIVTELNPMCDAPENEPLILFIKNSKEPVIASKRFGEDEYQEIRSGRYYCAVLFSGWLPIPIYDPSHKSVDDFSRGVRTMSDYLQTRIANNFSGNSETQAHLNEINKTLEEWLSDALEEVSESDYSEWITATQAYAAGVEKHKRGHERYEKLRKLNAQQFSALYERNILGENFDEMVDEL